MDAIAANPDADVALDAGGLKYISSSGLRVLAKLFKESDSVPIVNACPDVCNALDMTGFTDLVTLSKFMLDHYFHTS